MKELGELGFRDFQLFNQVMLAKYSWRILKNPDFLLVNVLKRKYFAKESFLSAKLGHNLSFTWRSIL